MPSARTDSGNASAGTGEELWDLETLARAPRLGAWMFEQFAPFVHGAVVEVGAGIGTFSHRLLARDVGSLLLIEPTAPCAQALRERFGADPRVQVACELLPESPALRERPGQTDFLLCQNVLEHIPDDGAATAAMARALRPGGRLTIFVPAHPRLYNALDLRYGHERRYSRERLARVVGEAGLELEALYSFNLLGVPGWLVSSLRGVAAITPASLGVYEALLRGWRPIERRMRLPWGLSLIAHARA